MFDLSGDRNGGIVTVIEWLMSGQLSRTSLASREQAEAILRGAPLLAAKPADWRPLALAYFGAIPVSAYGGDYSLGPDGVVDPHLGTLHAPRWPKLPVEGSFSDKLLRAVGSVRSEVSFDNEGRDPKTGLKMESLHVGLTLGLRP